jgi:hypothetical protein
VFSRFAEQAPIFSLTGGQENGNGPHPAPDDFGAFLFCAPKSVF